MHKIYIDTTASLYNQLQECLVKKLINVDIVSRMDHSIQVVFKELSSRQDIVNSKILKENYPNAQIILVVMNDILLYEALSVYPLQFIRKEYLEKDMVKAITTIQKNDVTNSEILTFNTKLNTIRIKVNDIIYIESYRNNIIIHTKYTEFQIRETLQKMLGKLQGYPFIQIHKSFIINQVYMQESRYQQVRLTTGLILPVGRKYKANI